MPKAKRKKYIIDKKFQLRTAFSVVGLTAAVSLIIIAAIASTIVYNNEKLNNIYIIEKNIFQVMQDTTVNCVNEGDYGKIAELLSRNHEHNLYNINRINRNNRLLLISLVVCVVLQGIVLFFLIIRITHRITGPVHVMSGYMKEIIEGKMPAPRDLRDRDQLREFYALFREMVESLKKHRS